MHSDIVALFSCYCAVVIIDPGISNSGGYQPYTDGTQMGVFVKVRNNSTAQLYSKKIIVRENNLVS